MSTAMETGRDAALRAIDQKPHLPPDLKDRVAALERLVPDVPPVFHHLFAMLPKPGAPFSTQQRGLFIRAVVAVADLVYGEAPMRVEYVQPETVDG